MISKNSLRGILSLFNVDRVLITPVIKECDLKSFQEVFENRLNDYLDGKVKSYRDYSDNELCIESVEYAVSLIRCGGKRIRPYVAFASYVSEGGLRQEDILKAGIALELFHSFALIHDDIIDNGKLRHDRDTTHVHVEKFISNYPRGDKKHVAESIAILAGDLIFSWSHEVIASLDNKKVQEIFFRMIEEVVAGQILDVSLMLQYEVEMEDLFKKNEYKTALYSFVNPMLIGAVMSGKNYDKDFYKDLGLSLGQAFQIQDDLLDIVGDPKKTGKKMFVDIEDGQHTLLTQYIFNNSELNDKNILMSLFGREVDEYSVQVLQKLFQDTGAINYAENEINSNLDKAKMYVTNSNLKENFKKVWLDFIELLNKRKS
jgi:geranylgeranyl diphosphate synthase type I